YSSRHPNLNEALGPSHRNNHPWNGAGGGRLGSDPLPAIGRIRPLVSQVRCLNTYELVRRYSLLAVSRGLQPHLSTVIFFVTRYMPPMKYRVLAFLLLTIPARFIATRAWKARHLISCSL